MLAGAIEGGGALLDQFDGPPEGRLAAGQTPAPPLPLVHGPGQRPLPGPAGDGKAAQ